MTVYSEIKSLIPQQYKEATNLNKSFEIFGRKIDELVDVFADLKVLRDLNNATGNALDVIGVVAQLKRSGNSDTDYRKNLRLKIFQNNSKAFAEDIIFILKTVTEATKIVYCDNPPAGYTIFSDGETVPTNLHSFLEKVSAAGVSVMIELSFGDAPIVFPLSPNQVGQLLTEDGDNLVTEDGFELEINYFDYSQANSQLLDLYEGLGFGYFEPDILTTESGDALITEEGDILIAPSNTNDIIGGGALPVGLI